jgi:hypothetical protein
MNIDVYITDAGLGYAESAYLLKLSPTENGNNYLIIDRFIKSGDDYKIGTVVELEDFYVEKSEIYDIKNSPLWGTFLFHFFLNNY